MLIVCLANVLHAGTVHLASYQCTITTTVSEAFAHFLWKGEQLSAIHFSSDYLGGANTQVPHDIVSSLKQIAAELPTYAAQSLGTAFRDK